MGRCIYRACPSSFLRAALETLGPDFLPGLTWGPHLSPQRHTSACRATQRLFSQHTRLLRQTGTCKRSLGAGRSPPGLCCVDPHKPCPVFRNPGWVHAGPTMGQQPPAANSLRLIPAHLPASSPAGPVAFPAPPLLSLVLSFWAISVHPDAQRLTDLKTRNIFKRCETHILLHCAEEKLEAQSRGRIGFVGLRVIYFGRPSLRMKYINTNEICRQALGRAMWVSAGP